MDIIEIEQILGEQVWLPLPPCGGKSGMNEPAIAHKAFQVYFMMLKRRSLKKVSQKLGKTVQLLERWSKEFHWPERARRWDEHRSAFSNVANWHLAVDAGIADERSDQPWLPLARGMGKDGANESPGCYSAFVIYYSMPPQQRSLRELARRVGRSQKLMEVWSSRYYWAKRTAAWDAHQARIFTAQFEQTQREKAVAEAQRVKELNVRGFQMSQKLMDIAETMLKFPLEQTVLERDESGHPTVIIKPPYWTFLTAASMALFAGKFACRAAQDALPERRSILRNTDRMSEFEDSEFED